MQAPGPLSNPYHAGSDSSCAGNNFSHAGSDSSHAGSNFSHSLMPAVTPPMQGRILCPCFLASLVSSWSKSEKQDLYFCLTVVGG